MSPEPEKRSDDDPATYFHGHVTRDCGEHRTVGSHRAWCYDCSEWCYPGDGAEDGCSGCSMPALRAALAASRADTDRLSLELFARERENELLRGGMTDPVDVINGLAERFAAERDAARVEVSQLRARLEKVREYATTLSLSKYRRDADFLWLNLNGLRRLLAEPLGSTEDPPAKEGGAA